MEALPKPKPDTGKEPEKVPDTFVYEVLEGKNIYYRGYREALQKNLPPESLMGSGKKQMYLIDLIVDFLKATLDKKQYRTGFSEPGVRFGKNSWVANDIIIYDAAYKSRLKSYEYLDFPPKVVIEVDTKAELRDFEWAFDYYNLKTRRLLDLGVEKVIWIFTRSRKIQVATPGADWSVIDWDKTVDVLPGCRLNLIDLIEADGELADEWFPLDNIV